MSNYNLYLDTVKDHLIAIGARLLTEEEESLVVAHLEEVSIAYNSNKDREILRLRLGQVLAIETAKKANEIHPDFPIPTKEQIERDVAEVLAR